MGRRESFLITALLVLTVILLAGCGGSSPSGPINTDNREYGPPFEPVAFDDGHGFLATVNTAEDGSDPYYVRGFGTNGVVSDMAYGFLIRPTSTPNSAHFAAFDEDTEMLYVIDSQGSETATFFNSAEIVPNMFTFSNGGARLVYVSEVAGDQELILEGVTTDDYVLITTLSGNQRFFGRPTVDITGASTRIAMMQYDVNTEETSIHIYDRNGTDVAQLAIPVQALKYSPDGDRLAFVDADNQTELVVYNSSLSSELRRVSFSTYGTGADALAWSPNSDKIAFFAGSAGTTGTLVVYDVSDNTMDEIFYDYEYVFPIGQDELWAQPNWNSAGTELTFTGRSVDGKFDVIKVNVADGFTSTLFEDVGDVRYVEWMEEQ